jgi:hypothetical protein
MKANQGANVLINEPADHGRLRSVLHDWGYTETEIQRFLNENEMSPLVQVSMNEQVYANAIRGQALPHE